MSIATLKRKTLAQYNNSSVGQPQFSLNGTRRSAGYVGQDTLGRSLVRSLSKNGALKGHGGCCGKYPQPQIKTSPEMCILNNSSIVKSSSLNTNGLFMSRYRWIRRPQPYSTTKADSNIHNNTQSSYIDYLARKTLSDSSGCHIISNVAPKSCTLIMSNGNYNQNKNLAMNITKPEKYTGAVNASDHIRNLDKKCTAEDTFKTFKIIKSTSGFTNVGCGSSSKNFTPLFPSRNAILVPGLINGTNTIA